MCVKSDKETAGDRQLRGRVGQVRLVRKIQRWTGKTSNKEAAEREWIDR